MKSKEKTGTINFIKNLISPIKLVLGVFISSVLTMITHFMVMMPIIAYTPLARDGNFMSFGILGNYLVLFTIMIVMSYVTFKWLCYSEERYKKGGKKWEL